MSQADIGKVGSNLANLDQLDRYRESSIEWKGIK